VRPAGLAHPARSGAVGEHAGQRLRERRRPRLDQEAGLPVDDRLGRSAAVHRDDRAGRGHRLQRHDAEVLGPRRVDDASRAGQQRAALGVGG